MCDAQNNVGKMKTAFPRQIKFFYFLATVQIISVRNILCVSDKSQATQRLSDPIICYCPVLHKIGAALSN